MVTPALEATSRKMDFERCVLCASDGKAQRCFNISGKEQVNKKRTSFVRQAHKSHTDFTYDLGENVDLREIIYVL